MASEPQSVRTDPDHSKTIINAGIGGIAGIVLSFIPFSPVLGGAVAGYLEGGTTSDGMRVGAIAGVITLIPFVLLGMFLLFFLAGTHAPLGFGLMGIGMLFFGALYTVGVGLVGGYLGTYIRHEL